MKRHCSTTPVCNPTDLVSQLQLNISNNLSPHELPNIINNTFLEPMQEFYALSDSTPEASMSCDDLSFVALITPELINRERKSLNRSKAPGPDGITYYVGCDLRKWWPNLLDY